MHSSETMMLLAAVMTAAGTWGQWKVPCYCSELEEDVKDRILSSKQARLRSTVVRYTMPALTGTGMGLLVMGMIAVSV